MRILMTSNYKLGNETGASQIADLLAERLSIKNEVIYLCLGNSFKITKANPKLTIIEFPSIEIKMISIPLFTIPAVMKTFEIFDKFKPDLVHLHNPVLISSFARLLANYFNVPVVITFHHIPTEPINHILPQMSKTELSKTLQYFYQKFNLKYFLSKIDGVIALNKSIYIKIKKIDKNVNISIINNGLDLDQYLTSKNIPKDYRYKFMFVGSYTDRKNQIYLLKVFKYLPKNFKLECYGRIYTDSEYFKKLTNYIKDNNVDNVKLNDFVDRNLIYKKYKKNDYFISASKTEAQSLAIIQALASGKPVVGLANQTINELIDNKNGLKIAKNTSPKKFAMLTKKFVSEIDYNKFSKNARSKIEKFDINIVILETQKFYKSICKSYSKKRRGNISQKYNQIFSKFHVIQ